jgi:hypothetical protein
MGYILLEAVLFVLGALAFVIGNVPLTRRRVVRASAARLVGAILMIPLPLYLLACKQSNVSPLGSDPLSLDPLKHETEGFVRLGAVMAAGACVLAATVLAIVSSEKRPRKDRIPASGSRAPEDRTDRPDPPRPDASPEDRPAG